jgi:hypothetical protein
VVIQETITVVQVRDTEKLNQSEKESEIFRNCSVDLIIN